jgi:hypothetical protein
LGWARACLLYERLKGVPDISAVQERLLLYVHAKKEKQRLLEMQIAILAGTNEHNQKQLRSLFEIYRRSLFPGSDEHTKQDKHLEQAKALLAKEAKKLYIMRPLDGDQMTSVAKKASDGGNTDLARVLEYESFKTTKEESAAISRVKRMKWQTPK